MHDAGGVGSGVSDSTEDLIRRAALGERDAEEDLVRRHYNGVRILVARRCRARDPAVDDITHDVLRSLVEALRRGALRDPSALLAYLQTSIERATTAEYRQRAKRAEEGDVAEELEDSSPDIGHALDQSRSGLLVRTLVEALPVERDRQVLTAFYFEDLDKDEISRRFGIDAEHLRRVLHRARERFRGVLASSGYGEGAA